MFNDLVLKANQQVDDIFADTDQAPNGSAPLNTISNTPASAPLSSTPPVAGMSPMTNAPRPTPMTTSQPLGRMTVPLMDSDHQSSGIGKLFKVLVGAILALIIIGAGAYFIYAKFLVKNFGTNANVANQTPLTNSAINQAATPASPNPVPTSSALFGSSTPTSTPSVPTSTLISIATQAIGDTDKDGLNDAEEALLGTDPTKADTNGNKYNDLTELLNLYNPVGTGRLESDPSIQKYSNLVYKYSILYPQSWKLEASADNSSVTITAGDNSLMQVVTQPNIKKQTLVAWYGEHFSQKPAANAMTKVGGLDAITNVDGLVVYAADKNNVYIISYTPALPTMPLYKEIFQMLVKSFTLIK